MGELEEYVKKQLDLGRDPERIKQDLMRTGWPEAKVDAALKDAQSGMNGLVLLGIGALVVIFLGGILFLMIPGFDSSQPGDTEPEESENDTEPIEDNTTQNNTTQDGSNESLQSNSCADKPFGEKRECYRTRIDEEGYRCEGLDDVREEDICYRALEDSLLN